MTELIKTAPVECKKIQTSPEPKRTLRARFLAWAIETAIGFLAFVIIFGNVAAPMFLSVSTSGWDDYSKLLWGFLMMVAIAAFMIRVIDSAKEGFRPVF